MTEQCKAEPAPAVRLSRAQSRDVDRVATERYHIPSIVLMENAARSFVDAITDLLTPRGRTTGDIVLLCGGGNNGGDGYAIARHLHNRGHDVRVVPAVAPQTLRGDALINWRIADTLGLVLPSGDLTRDRANLSVLQGSALAIDALFGTGLTRPPGPEVLPYIEACHATSARVARTIVAVDVPSGLDCDTGRPRGACVRATRTVTFVSGKVGFAVPESRLWTGDVVVGDIGIPPEVVRDVLRAE